MNKVDIIKIWHYHRDIPPLGGDFEGEDTMITMSSEANIELNKIYFGKNDKGLYLRIFVKAVG